MRTGVELLSACCRLSFNSLTRSPVALLCSSAYRLTPTLITTVAFGANHLRNFRQPKGCIWHSDDGSRVNGSLKLQLVPQNFFQPVSVCPGPLCRPLATIWGTSTTPFWSLREVCQGRIRGALRKAPLVMAVS